MRRLIFILIFVLTLSSVWAQTYVPKAGETVVKLEVEGRGNIFFLLHVKEAPKASSRILKLVTDGFYNGLRFHRVVQTPKPYLVQVGDPDSKNGDLNNLNNGGSGLKLPYEDSGFKNIAGAVGLARNIDDKNSGDSQFYILLDRSSFLDGNYTVFGQVVAGMDVVKKIQKGDRVVSATIEKG